MRDTLARSALLVTGPRSFLLSAATRRPGPPISGMGWYRSTKKAFAAVPES